MGAPKRKRKDLEEIMGLFPSVRELDWHKVLVEDPQIWVRLRADIEKAGQKTGKPGPRPPLDGRGTIDGVNGEEFTMLPFTEALDRLSRAYDPKGLSVRQLADMTGINRNLVHKLMNDKAAPDSYELTLFSSAFGKRPEYFLEYRIGYVLQFFHDFMVNNPESSVPAYTKLTRPKAKF